MSIKSKKKKPIWEIKTDENLQLIREALQNSIFTEEQLPKLLAEAWAWVDLWEEDFNKIAEIAHDSERVLNIYGTRKLNPELKYPEYSRMELLKIFEEHGSKAAKLLLKGLRNQKSHKGKEMANAKHDKPGGSREKQMKIRDIWASGKYTSRDRCAEEECGALGMSYSSARKALRNTPTPKT